MKPSSGSSLLDRVDRIAGDAVRLLEHTALGAEAADIRARLHRPLRVAIAGRAKAGKSTLLNALVGERLAATDATECTRIVTWYRHDLGYSVAAVLRDGRRRSLDFDRAGGLEIRLAETDASDIERLEVGWPSSRLVDLTLIDTPGLDGPTPDATDRTLDALLDNEDAGDADAVIYLLRHLHRRDEDFLEAFSGLALARPSPINAIALLSRADEVGSGRSDALASAAAIAARYAEDPRLRAMTTAVLPVAGLLAETGATLREDEVARLREVVAVDRDTLAGLLISVDRFRGDTNPLDRSDRERLLERLGLFGLRLIVATIVDRPSVSTPELSRRLVDASGISAVEAVIARSFAARADLLKSRSALARLRALAARAAALHGSGGDVLAAEVERVAASSHELAELRVLQLLKAGLVALSPDETDEAERVLGAASVAERLGLPPDVGEADLARDSLAGIERWRTRLAHPLLDRATAEAAEVIARTYEGLYQSLALVRS